MVSITYDPSHYNSEYQINIYSTEFRLLECVFPQTFMSVLLSTGKESLIIIIVYLINGIVFVLILAFLYYFCLYWFH